MRLRKRLAHDSCRYYDSSQPVGRRIRQPASVRATAPGEQEKWLRVGDLAKPFASHSQIDRAGVPGRPQGFGPSAHRTPSDPVANIDKAPKLDANLAGASGDFDALEKLRKLAFAEQVPEPAKQLLLPMAATDEDHESEED